MSASETPKSRLETRSFPPVSTPAPPPPPTGPLKPLKPLSYMSCCHLSGSCLGSGVPLPTGPGCSVPPRGSPNVPCPPHHYKQVNQFRQRTYTGQTILTKRCFVYSLYIMSTIKILWV
uniref:Uncharacterized protein n=1 Tax=Sander lucioperca TaxID=283035 RepID=A0A8C9WYY3_SANLU